MVEESCSLPAVRRMRLKQFKKILPSDGVSIEKNFPRFHEKCQTLKNRIKSSHDDVADLRSNEKPIESDLDHVKVHQRYPYVLEGQITMADHIEEITLQRGCWLQATLRKKNSVLNNTYNNANRSLPTIVYTHRKEKAQQPGSLPRSRAQLTQEVMDEFRRQKNLLLSSSGSSNTFMRSSYHNTLPIFNRASINLHTRRVS